MIGIRCGTVDNHLVVRQVWGTILVRVFQLRVWGRGACGFWSSLVYGANKHTSVDQRRRAGRRRFTVLVAGRGEKRHRGGKGFGAHFRRTRIREYW